ncbi:unnamed protein product [Knipowitschia caucasica]|uniref:Sperm-associated antigen 8 n=1 Tax=Knipowitschia caucasica TaxID=637954 RepID=A0AAV2IWE9_KNICA
MSEPEAAKNVASSNSADEKRQIQRHGHPGLLSLEPGAKMEDTTTVKATYIHHQSPGVRLKGRRVELLEKLIAHDTREQIEQQMKPAVCESEFCSTSQQSFTVQGFVPLWERLTPVHDYRSENSITFWSENCQQVQGVTPVRSATEPFKKCSQFSRPISERLDEQTPPLED